MTDRTIHIDGVDIRGLDELIRSKLAAGADPVPTAAEITAERARLRELAEQQELVDQAERRQEREAAAESRREQRNSDPDAVRRIPLHRLG